MSDNADHIIAELQRGEHGVLRISRARYEGRTFSKIHLWYRDKDGELKPGKNVVTIRDSELSDVIGALQRVAAKLGEAVQRPGVERVQQIGDVKHVSHGTRPTAVVVDRVANCRHVEQPAVVVDRVRNCAQSERPPVPSAEQAAKQAAEDERIF